jgi:hypothetical protein
MKSKFCLSISGLIICFIQAHSQNYAFENGNWFTGTGFSPKTVYAVNGKLAFKKPTHIDSVINLQNKYVIPPFGEAHNHNIHRVEDTSIFSEQHVFKNYLQIGVFYVKNPTVAPRLIDGTYRKKINIPSNIDAVFSFGGFTEKFGHPYAMFQRNIRLNPLFSQERDAEGNNYHTVHSKSEFDEKFPLLLKQKPDFVKTFLLYSEEYNLRKKDTVNFLG